MRRNLKIINLRDKPLYARPSYSSRHLKPIEYPRPRLSYVVLAGALFYCVVYLVIGLYGRPSVSSAIASSHLARAQSVPVLAAPEAPAPDMSSDDVRFAAADAQVRHAHSANAPEPMKTAAKMPPKKKKVHIVARPKEQPKEQNGWQAFAFSSFAEHRMHDGF